MGPDLLAARLLAVFAAVGFFRGALASALAIATLVLGYAAAAGLGPALGGPLAAAVGAPPLLGLPLGGAAAFAATALLVAAAGAVLRRRERARRGEGPRSPGDRALGAGLGALRGAFVVLLLGWLGLWLEAASTLRAAGGEAPVATVGGSHVGALAQRAVEGGAEALLGGTGEGRVAARVLARPAESLDGLRGVLESPRFEALRVDEAFWSALEAGDVDAALARGSFRLLAHDAGLRRDLAALGLVDDAAAADPAAVERELGAVVAQIAPRLAGLREDPELRALLEDPDVQAALERGDAWRLLGHAGFQRLVTRLAATPAPGA